MADFDPDALLAEAEPRLRRAYVAAYGVERAGDATAEALAWGWEHRDRLVHLDNPIGYLYRVGQSKTRRRRRVLLAKPDSLGLPEVEPRLISVLQELPERQRVSVWLVHACEWTQAEVADALGITPSSVSTHVARAMHALRSALEVTK